MGLNEASGVTNEVRTFFVFNLEKGRFENDIDLANVGLDNEAKIIYTIWSGGHAGRISSREWSTFVGYDSIRMVKEIQSDFDKKLSAYIIETKELNAAGIYRTITDTLSANDWH